MKGYRSLSLTCYRTSGESLHCSVPQFPLSVTTMPFHWDALQELWLKSNRTVTVFITTNIWDLVWGLVNSCLYSVSETMQFPQCVAIRMWLTNKWSIMNMAENKWAQLCTDALLICKLFICTNVWEHNWAEKYLGIEWMQDCQTTVSGHQHSWH